ncbi:MAG: iron-sulfur cluster assembly protein [Bacteroidales bacterium]|nr:iron-sulfur cluster assembly protein [Bacteroidales bacterium]
MAEENGTLQLEANIVKVLKSIYDPEIPVNIYDLGLIYEINPKEEHKVEIVMTLTAPNCPIADQILLEVKQRVEEVEGVKEAEINLVFDPPWDKEMMSEEALLELGLL